MLCRAKHIHLQTGDTLAPSAPLGFAGDPGGAKPPTAAARFGFRPAQELNVVRNEAGGRQAGSLRVGSGVTSGMQQAGARPRVRWPREM